MIQKDFHGVVQWKSRREGRMLSYIKSNCHKNIRLLEASWAATLQNSGYDTAKLLTGYSNPNLNPDPNPNLNANPRSADGTAPL